MRWVVRTPAGSQARGLPTDLSPSQKAQAGVSIEQALRNVGGNGEVGGMSDHFTVPLIARTATAVVDHDGGGREAPSVLSLASGASLLRNRGEIGIKR